MVRANADKAGFDLGAVNDFTLRHEGYAASVTQATRVIGRRATLPYLHAMEVPRAKDGAPDPTDRGATLTR
jgi:hypothetical protein